jgi:hypothetical protein
MVDLHSAIERLKDFRAGFNAEDPINGKGGLTAADIDTIVQHCEATEQMVPIRFARDLSDLAKE